MRRAARAAFLNAGFWIGWAVALLAFFEQCNDNGAPFWSTALGPPFLHHGYYGLALVALVWSWVWLPQAWKQRLKKFFGA